MGLPDSRSIISADGVATSLSANNYMRVTLNNSIAKNNMEKEYAPVNIALDENSRIVRVRSGYIHAISEKAFKGMASDADLENIKPGVMNFIEASVTESLHMLENAKNQISSVIMPYYIDETSQLRRGYVIDGEPA